MEDKNQTKNFFWGDKRFLASNISLILGLVAFFGSVGKELYEGESSKTMGWILVIGYFVLKSAKKRNLGLVGINVKRKILEVVGILFSLTLLYIYNQFAGFENIINYPLSTISFVYLLTAYLVIIYKNFFGGDKKNKIILVLGTFLSVYLVVFYGLYFLNTLQNQNSEISDTNMIEENNLTISRSDNLVDEQKTEKIVNTQKFFCADHLDSTHALVNELYPTLFNTPFDKYFYSSTLETCIVGIVKLEKQSDYETHTSYLILDAIKNKELFAGIGNRYSNPQTDHEREMNQSDEKNYNAYLDEIIKLQK